MMPGSCPIMPDYAEINTRPMGGRCGRVVPGAHDRGTCQKAPKPVTATKNGPKKMFPGR